jgi:3-methylcrotonyl-CoA carboxylase alpha subunit
MTFVPRNVSLRLGDGRATVHVGADGVMTVTPALDEAGAAATVTAHYLGHGRLHLHDAEGRLTAYAVDDGSRRWVFLEGEVYVVNLDTGPAARRRGHGELESLAAPMPATVVRVAVSPGARVARGDTLVVLEAMKMELPLRAPHDAIVAEIRCAEGDLVDPGVPLVELQDVESVAAVEGAEDVGRDGGAPRP